MTQVTPHGDQFYALEKYVQAVDELARPDGTDFERLEDAALYLFRIAPREMPDDLLTEHASIRAALTSASDEGDGTLRATINRMDAQTARAITIRIHAMCAQLIGTLGCKPRGS